MSNLHDDEILRREETALFSSFVDFGDAEDSTITNEEDSTLIASSSGMATPTISTPAFSSAGGSSPGPSSDSELDAKSFLSPPHSTYSPMPSSMGMDGSFVKLESSLVGHFPPSPAEPFIANFCQPSDLLDATDVDLTTTLLGPISWIAPITPLPSAMSAPSKASDDLVKMLRSDTANACQQLLSEPIRRKPGRKKKSEVQAMQESTVNSTTPLPMQLPHKLSSPPLPNIKSESDSDSHIVFVNPATTPLATPATLHSTRTSAAPPLQPASQPVPATLTKRQERMVKNREAADQSRKRKREHLASLETHAQALITENDDLRARVIELEGLNIKLTQENATLRAALGAGSKATGAGVASILATQATSLQLPSLMSSPGEMLEESGIKRARKDVFFGGEVLKAKPLGTVFMVFMFSFFLFTFPSATPPTTLIGNPANPSISSSWSAKAFDTILSSRPAVPRIDASPAPLLLPGVHRDIALVDGVNPLSFDRIQLPDVNQNSFVLTSSNAAIASPASEAIQNSLAIPIVNLSEVLATLSAEKGLSDVAKGRLEWLRSLLDQGRTARAEKVMVPLKHGSEEVFRRVGPHLVPAGKDLIPVSAGDHHQLPVVVEDYLATLRAETPVILPSKDENGLVEVVATPTELSESLAGATLAPGTQLFPSRFCPNRREGPILSLIANLPTNDMAEHSHESGHGDELLDPLSWGHGDLEQEFGKWLKGEAKRENEEGGRQVRKGGSFLQLDIEVVGARLVTLNDTL